MSIDKEQRALNVSFSKSGSGNITGRIVLPTNWLKELDISQDERQVIATKIDGKIIIEKFKNQ